MNRQRATSIGFMMLAAFTLAGVLAAEAPCAERASTLADACVTLTSPAAGAVLDNGCLEQEDSVDWSFLWEGCAGATQYNLHVKQASAINPAIDVIVSVPQYDDHCPGCVVASTTGWSWRVRAMVDGQWGEWTPERSFQVEPAGTDCQTSNQPPECSRAAASQAILWPPSHEYHAISVHGVTDPDGDPVTVTVTGVTQDEPVNATGDGNTCGDAQIVNGQVSLRAERAGDGNGRVYAIHFTADDGRGGQCSGTVHVSVPHDVGKSAGVDDGGGFDSLEPCSGEPLRKAEAVELHVGAVSGTTARLGFSLPAATHVQMTVFDVMGRRLATLENSELPAGAHERDWDMGGVANGVYFVRIQAGAKTLTRTVLKLR